jgi:hypothetical protein
MNRLKFWIVVAGGALTLAACGTAALEQEADAPTEGPAPSPTPAGSESTEPPTAAAGEEEAVTEPTQRPPSGADREFRTDFSKSSIPFDEILSGGPPKDGIPAVDNPSFISVAQADEWLEDFEPVVVFTQDQVTRIYPIQILMWHEIVNDVVAGRPVAITFCPLCNTAIGFDATVNGQALTFGTTGRLRFSNLLMYDRQTESWWQQATGQAVIGELTGTQLEFLPLNIIGWVEAVKAFPQAQVLSRETGFPRDYGRNPYAGYDDVRRSPFLYVGPETPDALLPMERVTTVELNGEAVAYPNKVLEELGVVNDSVGGVDVVVLWQPGVASALSTSAISEGQDVGANGVFRRQVGDQVLTFVRQGERIADQETGSQWDVLGRAIGGELKGAQLEPVIKVDHFWFSWAAFRPDTRVYQP